MKAAVLYEVKKPVEVQSVELPEPGPGEVMVKIMASGVCHSDWHVVKGDWDIVPLPSILGHEGAGIVEAVGPNVQGVNQGDHVVLSWKTNCGRCESCESGYPNLCERSPSARSYPTAGDVTLYPMAGVGTMAEYAVVPDVAAVPIDKDIPFPQAALVGCGVTTGVGAAINTARVAVGSTVAVFGCGGVGLNVIQGARIAGATTIIAVDVLDNKLDMGVEFGATHTVNSAKEDPVRRIKDLTGRKGVHYAFEAIGLVEEPFVQSVHCTRFRGDHGVGRPRSRPDAGDHRRARPDHGEDHHRLDVRHRAPPHRVQQAARPLQGGPPEARRAHHPPLPPRRRQRRLPGPRPGRSRPRRPRNRLSRLPLAGVGADGTFGLHTRP